MQTIFVMSFTGSILLSLILLLRPLLSKYAMFRLQYLLAKIAAIYFIVPLFFLKPCYEWMAEFIFQQTGSGVQQFQAAGKQIGILISENSVSFNNLGMIYFIISAVCLAIGFLSLIRYVYCYRKYTVLLRNTLPESQNEAVYALLKSLKEELSIKSDIQLLLDTSGNRAFYIGLIKPIIVIPEHLEERKAKLVLRHELLHIKHKDFVVKCMGMAALSMNWFNPLAYYLIKLMTDTCEAYCDGSMVAQFDKDKKIEYAKLLVELATVKQKKSMYVISVSDSCKPIKRRIIYIMKVNQLSKRIKKGIAVCSVMLAFSCSLTAFAYEKPIDSAYIEGADGFLSQQMDEFTQSKISYAGSQDLLYCSQEDIIIYQNQFIDENGNISNANKTTRRPCSSHPNVVPGYYQQHYSPGDGSCIVRTYHANQCTKCQTVIVGSLISESTFPKCIH